MLLFAAKSSLILIAALVITTCMRRSSAASRHVVWSCALLAVLLLPLASRIVPALPIPWLAEIGTAPSASEFVVTQAATLPERETFVASTAGLTGTAQRPVRQAALQTASISPERAASALAVLWALGAGLVLLRLVIGFVHRARLTRRCRPIEDSVLRNTTRRYASAMGISRRVRILMAPTEMMPATWGLLRPVVLLPPSAHTWSDERTRLVLVHELSHIVRFDTLTAAIAYFATALAWWNPLVWFAAKRAQLERERACDDAVIRSGLTPSRYASELLEMARSLPSPFAQRLALAMAKPHRIEQRLAAILDTRQRRTGTSHTVAALASVVMALQLPLAAVTVTPEFVTPPATPEPSPMSGFTVFAAVSPAAPEPESTQRAVTPGDALKSEPAPLADSGATSDYLGLWTPATPTDEDHAASLFDVGISRIRGAFSVTEESGGLIIRQELPPEIEEAFTRVMGRSPAEFTYAECGCQLSRRGDELTLTTLSRSGAHYSVAFRSSQAPVQPKGPQPVPEGNFGAGAYRPGNGVSNPIRIREVKPEYTEAARKAGLRGTVELEAVVGPEGTVTDVRVVRSLDKQYGLDENAKDVVRRTPFVPCKIGDKPVACVVVFELQFTPDPPTPITAGKFGAGAYRPGNGVTQPIRIRAEKPAYTKAALDAKIEGSVELEAVIGTNGVVIDARVVRSLDTQYGLDESALDAVRRTPFSPCKLADKPVPCVVTFELQFTVR